MACTCAGASFWQSRSTEASDFIEKRLQAANYFCKKTSIVDVRLGSKYASASAKQRLHKQIIT